ncbi:putative membrane protein [Micromonospora sp. A200]|uniref:DUF1345 domain-containing protein n=1 Tax=Micromonospora sp. A200 TaxID=2940568 RepID=UPI002475D16C|nr:DUF1345 domain-containing protein [Micromonospora sp. A200]MDH6465742.1 putative membrane protein [Micromonospora sp. A200]
MGRVKMRTPGRILSVRRLSISLAAGAVVAVAVTVLGFPELFPLVGWNVAASVVLVWVWRISWRQGPEGTERLAEEESRSRSTDGAVLIAAVASLGTVAWALVHSSGSQDALAVTLVIVSVLTAILSWGLMNTVFAFKYARMFYLEDGGIDFKQSELPAYSDFAYMAFTVGMSFAVSESEPASTRVRKTALGHALLSYLFGTVILAAAVNLVTGLGES